MPEIKPTEVQSAATIKVVGVGGAGGSAQPRRRPARPPPAGRPSRPVPLPLAPALPSIHGREHGRHPPPAPAGRPTRKSAPSTS